MGSRPSLEYSSIISKEKEMKGRFTKSLRAPSAILNWSEAISRVWWLRENRWPTLSQISSISTRYMGGSWYLIGKNWRKCGDWASLRSWSKWKRKISSSTSIKTIVAKEVSSRSKANCSLRLRCKKSLKFLLNKWHRWLLCKTHRIWLWTLRKDPWLSK